MHLKTVYAVMEPWPNRYTYSTVYPHYIQSRLIYSIYSCAEHSLWFKIHNFRSYLILYLHFHSCLLSLSLSGPIGWVGDNGAPGFPGDKGMMGEPQGQKGEKGVASAPGTHSATRIELHPCALGWGWRGRGEIYALKFSTTKSPIEWMNIELTNAARKWKREKTEVIKQEVTFQ